MSFAQGFSVGYGLRTGVIVAALLAGKPALAQHPVQQPASSDTVETGGKIYTFVDQMPTLPGGGGNATIVAAIMHFFVAPKHDETGGGSVNVEFIVTTKGAIDRSRILKAPSRALGQAVLDALQKLPRFKPGKHKGHLVPVRFTLRISCIKLQ